jgi:hypothetical protein
MQRRPKAPSTLMQDKFLAALMRWLARGGSRGNMVALPTGKVTAPDLARVICALKCVGRERDVPRRRRAAP